MWWLNSGLIYIFQSNKHGRAFWVVGTVTANDPKNQELVNKLPSEGLEKTKRDGGAWQLATVRPASHCLKYTVKTSQDPWAPVAGK